MKATVTTKPISILLSPESNEDDHALSELMRVINRRPFVAEEVADIIRVPSAFGEAPHPHGVLIRCEVKQ